MKISDKKRDRISEHILSFLYNESPKTFFTSKIAEEIARDEEFVKSLLFDLKDKNLVVEIKKNPKGKEYLRRSRWKISGGAYQIYNNDNSTEIRY